MDHSLPGSVVHGIFQARILEWAAISFPRGFSQSRDRTRVSYFADRRFTVWAKYSPQQCRSTGAMRQLLLKLITQKIDTSVFNCMLNCFSHAQLLATLGTITCQVLLSLGFSRKEYWSGLPSPLPGNLPNPGVKPVSLTFPALAGGFFTTRAICTLSFWRCKWYIHEKKWSI